MFLALIHNDDVSSWNCAHKWLTMDVERRCCWVLKVLCQQFKFYKYNTLLVNKYAIQTHDYIRKHIYGLQRVCVCVFDCVNVFSPAYTTKCKYASAYWYVACRLTMTMIAKRKIYTRIYYT